MAWELLKTDTLSGTSDTITLSSLDAKESLFVEGTILNSGSLNDITAADIMPAIRNRQILTNHTLKLNKDQLFRIRFIFMQIFLTFKMKTKFAIQCLLIVTEHQQVARRVLQKFLEYGIIQVIQ